MVFFNAQVKTSARCLNSFYTLTVLTAFTNTYIFCFSVQYSSCKKLQYGAFRHCIEHKGHIIYKNRVKPESHPHYILLWPPDSNFPKMKNFPKGDKPFKNCDRKDCFITDDIKYFGNDLWNFGAILFHGPDLDYMNLPHERYEHQKYIFMSSEVADNYPVCNPAFDIFFNWTFTYKLDSDIMYPNFQVTDAKGKVVGPSRNMTWKKSVVTANAEVDLKWRKKNKAVAWIVSKCIGSNQRDKVARRLAAELKIFNLTIDTYGECGTRTCTGGYKMCWKHIEKNYYFALAFEDNNAEDYVSEQLLKVLEHYTIPIVFGGANYSRFLPPGSYLDATKLSTRQLVAKITNIMLSKDLFKYYFRWQTDYKFSKAETSSNCALCYALHDAKTMRRKHIRRSFRRWWMPKYKEACSRKNTWKNFTRVQDTTETSLKI